MHIVFKIYADTFNIVWNFRISFTYIFVRIRFPKHQFLITFYVLVFRMSITSIGENGRFIFCNYCINMLICLPIRCHLVLNWASNYVEGEKGKRKKIEKKSNLITMHCVASHTTLPFCK